MSVRNHIPPQNIAFTMHLHKDIQIKYATTAIYFTVLFIISIYIWNGILKQNNTLMYNYMAKNYFI